MVQATLGCARARGRACDVAFERSHTILGLRGGVHTPSGGVNTAGVHTGECGVHTEEVVFTQCFAAYSSRWLVCGPF